MNKTILLNISTILLCFCIPFLGQAQNKAKLKKEIQKIINYDTDIDFSNTPAYIIGVKIQDSTYIYSYGSTEKRNNISPTADNIFEIGGLTKSFTSLLAGLITQSGSLNPDSSVNTYLPLAYRNPAAQNVRIIDLIQHTSGLPRLPRGIGLKEKDRSNPFGHYTKVDLLHYYKNFIPKNNDKIYAYSHTNYALLEIILENITGQTYEALLQEYIFTPFDMTQSGVDKFPMSNCNKIIQGYSLGGQPTAYWQMASFAGSEGIKSSMNDLMKYMEFNIKTSNQQLEKVLNVNQKPSVKTKLTKNTFGGNGWHIIKNKRYYNTVFHPGKTTGYRSFMGFVPETETGVIILSNSPTTMNGLGLLILRMINNNWKRGKQVFKVKYSK